MLVQAVKEGVLTKQEALMEIKSLAETSFQISESVVRKAVGLLENV